MNKKIILLMFLFIPFISVNALNCYKNEIDVTNIDNFSCSEIEGEKLKFSYNGEDYTNYFPYVIENKKATITPSKDLKFDSNFEKGFIIVSDNASNFTLTIKNQAYTTTKKTESTTTTKDANIKEVTVTLDSNNGTDKTTKTCKIANGSSYCNVTLPKLDIEGFTGWGTASTCKEGSSGSIKVEKDITYYACNEKNSSTTETGDIYLKTLKLTNKDTKEEINIGTFSIRKTEYNIKVLNEVQNIEVNATSDEGVKIDITGNENLKVGENEIVIKLTSSDNKTNEYKIKVNRLKVGEKITNIHYLKSLVIGGYNINFNKDNFNYTITISNEISKLEITPIVEDTEDRYEILNNNDLANGSIVKINVIGSDNTTTTYNINIIKENNQNLLLYIGIGVIALLVILLIILIIIKSNKNKKNNKNEPKTLDNNIEVLNI